VKLRYVTLRELERIRTAALADACLTNTLCMVMRAGSGHIGTARGRSL
jgi:hypothetical protein